MEENEDIQDKKEKKAKKEPKPETVKAKGGAGKSILAFFIGVLFGIILLIGGVVGAGFYVAKTDLDRVLGWFNLDNSADENGENKYINTDVDNGGVANIIELVQRVMLLAGNVQNLTLGEIDDLVPAARGLVDQIIEAVQDYVTVDYDELSAVRFSEFEAYFSDLVLDIRPAVIVEKSGNEINKLMDLVLYGVEAKCVTKNGILCPVYRDTVTGTYIYQYNSSWYVAEESDGVFTATTAQYVSYNKANTEATGNYYTVNGARQIIDPITIRSFVGTDGLGALGKATVADLIGDMSTGDSELIEKILGDITLNDLMNGNVDLEEKINSIQIGDVIDAGDNKILQQLAGYTIGDLASAMDELEIGDLIDVSADNSILAYLAYGITEVDADAGTAVLNGEKVFIKSEEKELDGKQTTVIVGVYYDEACSNPVAGTTINGINGRLNALTSEVKIKDIIKIDESSSLLVKLGDCTLDEVADKIEEFEIADILDVEPDGNAIVHYLAFGVTKVDYDGTVYSATKDGKSVYFKTREREGKIYLDSMYSSKNFEDGTRIAGTTISGVGDQLTDLAEKVEIKYLIEIDESNKLMSKIGEYTINNISQALDDLYLSDVLDISADSSILAYLAYGITEINVDNKTAKLGEQEVYLVTESSGEQTVITGVYYDRNHTNAVEGTLINDVGTRVDNLTKEVKIKDIIEIDPDNKLMSKIGNYTISEMGDVVDILQITDVMEVEADSVIVAYLAYGITKVDTERGEALYQGETVTIKTETNDNGALVITGVYHLDGTEIEGTKINDMTARIDGLKEDLTIGELMGIDESSSNTIMKAIKNSTINSLSDDIDKLTINELYAESIYGTAELKNVVASGAGEGEIEFNTEYLYYETVDGEYKLVDGTGKVEAYRAGLYTYGATTGLWKLLVVERDEASGTKSERAYTLNSITEMADNAKANLQSCTLFDLESAGILDFSDSDANPLESYIPNLPGIAHKGEQLGSLTISGAIEAIASLMNYIQ